MSYIEKEVIEKIRTSNDIVSLIGSYFPLTQKGKNFFCVCPFHDDHSPSLCISKEKQIYTCFSCGATGNVFSFIMNYENMNFVEAVSFLGSKVGININFEKKKINSEYKDLYDAYNTTVLFYKNNLNSTSSGEAISYLKKRKLSQDIIKKFEIGLSIDDSLHKVLEKKYNIEDIVNIGLVNEIDGKISDVFKNRIMFPIHDNDGNVVAFSGRIYKKDDTDSRKYLNTKETSIFKKGKILYNLHNAKEYIRKEKQVIICEGFMDVIRLYTIGMYNCIALMGTSFTKDQLEIIKRLNCEVILNLDRDSAGEKATYVIGNLLKSEGILCSVMMYEGVKDTDEYVIKNGKDAFINIFNNRINFIDFEMDYLKKNINLNDSVELTNYINKVLESLSKIDDEILVELKIKQLSEEYGINKSTLSSKIKLSPKKKVEVKNKDKPKRYNKYEISEIRIIYLMLNYPQLIKTYEKKLGYLINDDMIELANEIVYFKDKHKEFDYSMFITYIEENENLKNAFKKITNYNNNPNYSEEEIEDYINTIKEYSVKKRIKNLTEEMKNTYDFEKKKDIASKIEKIKKDVLEW